MSCVARLSRASNVAATVQPQATHGLLSDSFFLRGVWWLPMAATNASSLTEGKCHHDLLLHGQSLENSLPGLKSKLYSSSLPLEARCRLATNVITCRVAVPHRLGGKLMP